MRSFRSKPVGWQNDSYRHYLASKGISTAKNRKFVAMSNRTGLISSYKTSWDSGASSVVDDNKAYVEKLRKEGYGDKFYVDTKTGRVMVGLSEKNGMRTRLIDVDLLDKKKYMASKKDDSWVIVTGEDGTGVVSSVEIPEGMVKMFVINHPELKDIKVRRR